MGKIIELLINVDELEFEDVGVDVMSLVGQPAIGIDFLAFSEEQPNYELVLEYFKSVGETVNYDEVTFVDSTSTEFSTLGDYLAGIRALDVLGKRGTTSEPETKYRYSGPRSSNSRDFCRAMLSLNKIYEKDEIEGFNSQSLNPGFGGGSSSYNMWEYKGGPNCQHGWEKLSVFKRDGSTVILSEGRASGLAGEAPERMDNNGYKTAQRNRSSFSFSDDEQMIVTGPAMTPNSLILRKDEDGNPFHVFFSKDTIKEIAKKFFELNKMNNTDVNHDDNIVTSNTLLESWIVEDPEMDKSKSLGFDVPEGTWMTSYKINDEETWQKIKNGELNGFSIAGSFLERAYKA